jgi:hypothetical protein
MTEGDSRSQTCPNWFTDMKKTILIFLFILTGCGVPIGQIPESDFIWHEKKIDANYQEVYRRIQTGFRSCSQYETGYPEGTLYTDIKMGQFDIYLPGWPGQRTTHGASVIKITEGINDSSIIRIGIVKRFKSYEKKTKLWFNFADKNYNCDPE